MRWWLWILALGLFAACGATERPELVAVPPTATPVPTPTPVPPTPTPVPTPTPTATPTPACVTQLPLRVALGQLLLPLATPDQFEQLVDLAADRSVSGVVVLGSPTREDIAGLPTVDAAGVAMLLSSDEEGGRVQRLGSILGPLPSAATFATMSPADVRVAFRTYGQGMTDLGFGMAFAPVIDVGDGPGIGDRSYSADPAVVTEYGQAVIDGYLDAGIIPVVKHFPGHGRASADSHLALPTAPSIDELRASDLLPFQALAGQGVAVMVAHLLVPGLTTDLPTSLSPAAIDGLLRAELGFDGLVVTDAMNMNAISDRWGNGDAVRLALVAGADLAIIDGPEQVMAVLDHLEAAVAEGMLLRSQVDDSVRRVLAAKGTDACAAVG